MTSFRTKIGTVRFKSGGELRVLPDRKAEEHNWLLSELTKAVDDCVGARNGDMAGYALVTWGADRGWSASVSFGERSHVKDTQIPTFVLDALRRRLWRQDARYEAESIVRGGDDDWL